MESVPNSLAPFFQEYNITKLVPEKDSHTIIERVLQYGNRSEIKWLFTTYSENKIREWVKRWATEILPEPDRTFWQTILEVQSQ